ATFESNREQLHVKLSSGKCGAVRAEHNPLAVWRPTDQIAGPGPGAAQIGGMIGEPSRLATSNRNYKYAPRPAVFADECDVLAIGREGRFRFPSFAGQTMQLGPISFGDPDVAAVAKSNVCLAQRRVAQQQSLLRGSHRYLRLR